MSLSSPVAAADFPAVDPGLEDGRRRRSADSRRRIVAALIELVQGGEFAPSAEQVSRLAGVSLRSVFRHFLDMDSLYQEMMLVIETELAPGLMAPLPAGDWAARLEQMIDRRVSIFERLAPFQVASRARWHQSPVLRERHDLWCGLLRRRLEVLAAPEFGAHPALFEALDLLLSFESWQRLRDDQGLDPVAIRNVLRSGALALSAAAGV